jgi:hypothetical protein
MQAVVIKNNIERIIDKVNQINVVAGSLTLLAYRQFENHHFGFDSLLPNMQAMCSHMPRNVLADNQELCSDGVAINPFSLETRYAKSSTGWFGVFLDGNCIGARLRR